MEDMQRAHQNPFEWALKHLQEMRKTVPGLGGLITAIRNGGENIRRLERENTLLKLRCEEHSLYIKALKERLK